MSGTTSVPARVTHFLGNVIAAVFGQLASWIGSVLNFCEEWLTGAKRARYGTAVMRIILGIVGLGILGANFGARSYLYGPASFWNGENADPHQSFPHIWLFSTAWTASNSIVAVTLMFLVLAALAVLLILGWRTRLILPLFLVGWISLIELNSAAGDQGDNAYRICLFWLLFADSSGRLSLDARRRARPVTARGRIARIWQGERVLPAWLTNGAHNLVLVILTAQVSFIYAAGALYKAGGEPWAEGIAVYAPLHVTNYGPWPLLSDLITTWGPAVAIASWGSIVLQMSFPFMLLHRFTRVIALVGILGFHAAIGLFMGLPWFSLSMVAIDAIFVRDVTWQGMGRGIRGAWARAGRASPPVDAVRATEDVAEPPERSGSDAAEADTDPQREPVTASRWGR